MRNTKHITLLFLLIFFNIETSYAIKQTPAGIVTLVIGKTQAIDAQGETRILKRQDTVFIGDTIKTNQGAHLHIKFIDDARISIRPDSKLYIESYHYDPKEPENNAIRFFLETGILRSISGKATEAAHDRYRMNTPVAALGVLGTDYIIKTSAQKTLAAVYRGSIALSPLTHDCSTTGFGVCNSAKILSDDMKNLYLEVRRGAHNTIIKSQSRPDEIIDDKTKTDKKIHPGTTTISDKTPLAEPINKTADTDLASKSRLGVSRDNNPPVAEKKQPEEFVSAFTWTRWTEAKQADDKISHPRNELPKNQKVTVGNQYAGLFKNAGNEEQPIPQTGLYNFQIQQSHAVFIRPGQTWINADTATLNKSELQIDFGKRQVNTHLEMSAPGIQPTQMNVTGTINNNGIFVGTSGRDKIAGAVTKTGEQAGMLFEKPLTNGRFKGISTWQKQ